MSKQITITIPDEIYNRLTMASDESMRPVATEAVYRIRLGLDSIMYKDLTPKKATPKEAIEFTREALSESDVVVGPGFKTYFKKPAYGDKRSKL